jgi:hypothetical protein
MKRPEPGRLPPQADPITGAFVGTVLLGIFLDGLVGLLLLLAVWAVVEATRRRD